MNFNWLTLEGAATTGNAAAQGGAGGLLMTALPLIIMVAAMYFLIIRPQKKKEKAEKQMRDNLQVGDEIITIGGIYGRVISLKEDAIVIESKSDHSKMTIARWAMQQNLTVHDDTPSK
ncbi:MAG: preprotein translocase subunit YajC [Clostridia bacterium]|nr:preprotein translocase subunit YajC [Clostridia bacterium]